MKTVSTIILATLAVCAFVFALRANQFPPAQAESTVNLTLLSTSMDTNGIANATGTAQFIESVRFHTIQANIIASNTATAFIDFSLDATNWIPVWTNAVTSGTNGGSVTFTGKWSWIRSRFTGTNSSATVLYLGQ